ncbi:D-glycero-beta-D-manno-heptose 1-phosphate adenylyltransferase [Chitinophagales bacterium]|nr:D-glycero-beta-D-manno-heptose 1-phosphate adenylyltransferase [Chitinophagales bacterium]
MSSQKIVNLISLKHLVARWKVKSNRIVFTNGCFDILHVGHIHTLKEALKLGDKLIVGVNSDQSVKRLKGEERPLNNEHDRAELIASMAVVDAVVIFDEDTPLSLIKATIPDVLVKGGDWRVEEIVGGELVQQAGGDVVSIPFVSNQSSTQIIQKIKSL